ncbi:YhjD/YihY/BrkB family envelope integrity protein [Streptomyces sp. NPDC002004]
MSLTPEPSQGKPAQGRRERVIRTLTFWLRPAFALRVVNRFQRIVGFDRSMALASSALTATIPFAILCGIVSSHVGAKDIADRVVDRYDLTGSGAEAVRDVFSPSADSSPGGGILGTLLLMISVLSFTRAAQRLFEQTWELKPLSVRNTVNGLKWVLSFVVYLLASSWIHAALGHGRLELVASLVEAPLTAVFFVWSGWVLSAKRIAWRDLLPFGAIGAVLVAAFSIGATVYLPRLFTSYASRYGAVGAVFAMLSALFGVMLVVVGSATLGREVLEELVRIRRGERPPDDEVRRQWDTVVEQMRSHWRSARRQLAHLRSPKEP